jgi:succinate dehydrogenase / fumarate reductase flavoprotein subunit
MVEARNRIVVVGNTVSGALAALSAVEEGASVQLVSRAPLRRSCDSAWKEGIAGVFDGAPRGDSIEQHVCDTILGGDYLAHQGAVREMCEHAPSLIRLCQRMGVPFNRTAEGVISRIGGSGMSFPRTVHVDAVTGQQVLNVLDEQVRRCAAEGKLALHEYVSFGAIVRDDGGACRGIIGIDLKSLDAIIYPADAVVLCVGGYAGIYGTSTVSDDHAGAALAQAYLQGADIANPEFVQFHPAAIPGADKSRSVGEISFALGARLGAVRNERPWYFIDELHPRWKGGVPFDVAARDVSKAMEEAGSVFLDFEGADPDALMSEASRVLEFCRAFSDRDPLGERVEVRPAAHYAMGGLWVDGHHMTTVPGLFAAGESDYGYHGANCLGPNVLLAALHGGMVAGRAASSYADGLEEHVDSVVPSVFERERALQESELKELASNEEGENARGIRRELGAELDKHMGIVRRDDELSNAAENIARFSQRCAECRPADKSEWVNGEIIVLRDLKRLLSLGDVMARAAAARAESRGTHFKPSHPNRDDAKWSVVTRVKHAAGGPAFSYKEAVDMCELKPRERIYG